MNDYPSLRLESEDLVQEKPLNVMQTLYQSDRDFHCIVSCLIRALQSGRLVTQDSIITKITGKKQLFL